MLGDIADRRAVLGAGLASLVGGCCAKCADLTPLGALPSGVAEIGDAHVHLFNAADLPVKGFAQHVLLPKYLKDHDYLWPALIDLVGWLKRLAVTAEQEQNRLFPPWSPKDIDGVEVKTYANSIATRIETQVRARGPRALTSNGADTDLGDSYAALALIIAEASALGRGAPGPLSTQTPDQRPMLEAVTPVDRNFLARVAVQGGAAVPVSPNPALLPRAMSSTMTTGVGFGAIWAGIKWVYDLIQPRCAHVRTYLTTIGAPNTRTTLLINLLVDFDQWLGDGPTDGSGNAQQVRFWTRYARAAAGRVTIKTFAPYDPLRHVEELRRSGGSAHFDALKRWYEAPPGGEFAVAGFKLYPPMGFRPDANKGLVPMTNRSGLVVRERWARPENNWPIDTFGDNIDAALDTFFAYCSERDIPLLAHANDSNEASSNTGKMAHPRFWLERARKTKIRICLGHFITESSFIESYREILENNQRNGSNIYIDIGDATELLDGGGADMLLGHIERLCRAADNDCKWFLFGSDWIMLGRVQHAERYVSALNAALDRSRSRFWQVGDRRDNLMRGNLRRFLKMA